MTSTGRLQDWLCRAAWISPLILAAVSAWLVYAFLPLRRIVRTPVSPSTPRVLWADAPRFQGLDWKVLHSRSGAAPTSRGTLAGRFRLAGTFFAFGGAETDSRKAILDELASGSWTIVSERDVLDDVTVVRILQDRVVLRVGNQEEELWLGFAKPGGSSEAATDAETAGDEGLVEAADWLGGRQVGDNRWVFSRDQLLAYYDDLMNEPERLVAVFDSLDPVYTDSGTIDGYVLDVKGEGEFFRAVGMRPGDVVRKVNSMAMSNRRRAEYFIREFVGDRANAFVLDIERDGEPMKLIYQVR